MIFYARRDLRSRYGLLRDCKGNPKWILSEKIYNTMNEEEKRKWQLMT